jgi:hypothetical protein
MAATSAAISLATSTPHRATAATSAPVLGSCYCLLFTGDHTSFLKPKKIGEGLTGKWMKMAPLHLVESHSDPLGQGRGPLAGGRPGSAAKSWSTALVQKQKLRMVNR